MLHALAKHSGWSLAINCKGDLHSTLINHLRHRPDD
jgi:imidazoleglycerol phosphate dehydratase HisB